MAFFPRQDIPESEKNDKWYADHLDYGIHNFDHQKSRRVDRINRINNSFNGIISEGRTKYLTHTYGKKNRGKFKPFRIAKNKYDQLQGEYIQGDIKHTVSSININAQSEKLDSYHVQVGLMNAAEEVDKLRNVVGVDVFDGMPVPDKNDPEALNHMNAKSMNENCMQLMLDYMLKFEDLKTKLLSNYGDTIRYSECFGKVEIKDNDKETYYREIDPRNALFEEIDRDPFLKKTPYLGEYRKMFVHDILAEFPDLTKEQRDKLEELKNQQNSFLNSVYNGRNYYTLLSNNLAVDVFTMEWKSLTPIYTKITQDPRTPGVPHKKNIDAKDYEENKEAYDRDVAKGKYTIETRWKVFIYEATQIGHEIKCRCRRKPYQVFSESNPTDTDYGFKGMLFGTIDGVRISFWEATEELSFLYDVCMFQINRELGRLKGNVVVYDRAFLPKGVEMKDVLYDMANDGIYTINSAQDGNRANRELNITGGIKSVDMGVSNSLQVLITLKADIMQTLDSLTGMNRDRAGQTAASATATNAQQNISASRSITEPMYYYFNRFTENVFKGIMDHTKISWGLLGSKKARLILGDANIDFLRAVKDVMNDDFASFVGDGRREKELREDVNKWAETSLNTKELRISDLLEINMADTLGQAVAILKRGWEDVKKINERDAQMRSQDMQKQQQMQMKMAIDDREDRQAHDLEKIAAMAHVDAVQQGQKDSNALEMEHAKSEMNKDDSSAKAMMGKR